MTHPTTPTHAHRLLLQVLLATGLATLAPWAAAAQEGRAATAAPATPVDAAAGERARALFARYWEESAQRFPEWATYRGDHRFNDRWRDGSDAGVAATDRWNRDLLAEALALPREALGPQDRLSLDLFIERLRRQQAMAAFDGWRRLSLGSQGGFQTGLASLMQIAPARHAEDAEQALARLRSYPARLAQEIERVRGAARLGWVTARPVLERSLAQLDGQLARPAAQGPYFDVFRRLPDELTGRAALRERAESLINAEVLPAQRRLRAFIAEELLPQAPPDGGLQRYPEGGAVYTQLVRDHTTTELTPQQVHALGLAELARLRQAMDEIQREMKFDGTRAEFIAQLKQPQHFYATPEAMLEGYRAIAKRLDPEMPRLFAELPRTPYGIRPMPAFLGAGAADNYNSPPPDGSQPGWYNANILAYQRRPRWALPTLVAHETVPGHHLQSARAVELGELPDFRRQGRYTAYGEGWALYAETLGTLVGLYDTPETRLGHLQAQAFRAARLVVDTGLHALGWSRQRAIDTMIDELGESAVFVESEVDRYLSNPGQALAYMVGKLKIDELRDRARAALGPRFDLRRFHNAVLDAGPLPLTVLDAQIDAWIAARRSP